MINMKEACLTPCIFDPGPNLLSIDGDGGSIDDVHDNASISSVSTLSQSEFSYACMVHGCTSYLLSLYSL